MENLIINKPLFQVTDNVKEWLIFIIRLLCIALFLFSASEKLVEHTRFLHGLAKVNFIGNLVPYIAWLVPISEIIATTLMIIPQTWKWGLYAFTGLMVVFTGYVTSMVLWADNLPCQCNIIIEKLSWTQHIWFNLTFIGLAGLALWLSKIKKEHKNKYHEHFREKPKNSAY